MEFAPHGPIDRLFRPLSPAATPVEVPQLEATVEAPGFKLKGWHLAVGIGVLLLGGVVVWKVRQAKNKKDS